MARNRRTIIGQLRHNDDAFWTLWIGLGLGLMLILVLVIIAPSLFNSNSDDTEQATAVEAAEPVEDADAEAVEEADAAADEATDPIAPAAGTYWLSETSARSAVESTPGYEFESAEGAIVIEEDGSVSGDFSYVFWGPWEEGISRVTADTTIDPAAVVQLEATDAGLTFEAPLVVQFLIEPPDRGPYTNPGSSYQVAGFVYAEGGLLELTQQDGSGATSTFDFLR